MNKFFSSYIELQRATSSHNNSNKPAKKYVYVLTYSIICKLDTVFFLASIDCTIENCSSARKLFSAYSDGINAETREKEMKERFHSVYFNLCARPFEDLISIFFFFHKIRNSVTFRWFTSVNDSRCKKK